MFNYAFSNFSSEKVVKKHAQVKNYKTLPVLKGKAKEVKIYTKDSLNLVVKNGEKQNYKTKVVIDKKLLNKDGELTAPIKKGDKVGYIRVEAKDGEDIQFLDAKDTVKVDLIAAEDVEKANWFVLAMRGIGGFFADIWNGISSTVKGWF